MDILSVIILLKIMLAIVILGGLIFIFFASCSIYTNITSGVPWAKVPEENINKIFQEVHLPKNSLIYDLGCGDGRVVFMAAKRGYRAVGFELSLYPFTKALCKKIVCGRKVTFKRRDYFKENLKQADAIFVFLVGRVMDRVGRKLKPELNPGALVISYGFPIPGWQIEKTIATKPSLTYVYKIR